MYRKVYLLIEDVGISLQRMNYSREQVIYFNIYIPALNHYVWILTSNCVQNLTYSYDEILLYMQQRKPKILSCTQTRFHFLPAGGICDNIAMCLLLQYTRQSHIEFKCCMRMYLFTYLVHTLHFNTPNSLQSKIFWYDRVPIMLLSFSHVHIFPGNLLCLHNKT